MCTPDAFGSLSNACSSLPSIVTAAMLKRPRSVSQPAMSFACRVWLTQAGNRYQPKRGRSCPPLPEQDSEVDDMQIDPPLHRRTYTFAYRSVSMEDVDGQQ